MISCLTINRRLNVDFDLTHPALRLRRLRRRAALRCSALHAAQSIYGHLPEPVAAEVARTLRVPLADVHGVIDFYSTFYRGRWPAPWPVCCDPACSCAG